ncbi:hypothetical protein SAMN06265348_116102 [Pedobacter westerhofensis]|uniref:Uncharacterized protein n=1 Tax=Pedobacter westerhofensis TaxID=425512 RepID=A0A521FQE6_9SPHI|nr:hypothetical protein [Pedobacter westerhofensis]SMO98412.1 hypothetical protein SAMN06265348_116102 [Pedobacter westerhofensis]
MAINKNNTSTAVQLISRTIFCGLILLVLCVGKTRAQSALRFKLYEKEVVFDEGYLDQSFASLMNTKRALIKNRDQAYAEYYNFKATVIRGNKSGQYIVVDNLHRFSLYPFESNYYAQEGTDRYESLLNEAKKAGTSGQFKKINKLRNDILGWIIDLTIVNGR